MSSDDSQPRFPLKSDVYMHQARETQLEETVEDASVVTHAYASPKPSSQQAMPMPAVVHTSSGASSTSPVDFAATRTPTKDSAPAIGTLSNSLSMNVVHELDAQAPGGLVLETSPIPKSMNTVIPDWIEPEPAKEVAKEIQGWSCGWQ